MLSAARPVGASAACSGRSSPCTDQPPAAASPGPRSAWRQVPSCPAAGWWLGWPAPRAAAPHGSRRRASPCENRRGASSTGGQGSALGLRSLGRWEAAGHPTLFRVSFCLHSTRGAPQHLEPARNSRRGDGDQLTASTRGQRGDNAPFLDGSRLRSEAEPESRACRDPPSRGTSVLPARRDPPRTDGAALAGRSSGRGLLTSRFFPDSIFPYNLNDSCCNNKQAARRITSHFPARAKNLAAWPFFGCFPSNPSAQTEVGQFCASGMGR